MFRAHLLPSQALLFSLGLIHCHYEGNVSVFPFDPGARKIIVDRSYGRIFIYHISGLSIFDLKGSVNPCQVRIDRFHIKFTAALRHSLTNRFFIKIQNNGVILSFILQILFRLIARYNISLFPRDTASETSSGFSRKFPAQKG